MSHFIKVGDGKYRLFVELGYDHKKERIRHTKTVEAKDDIQAGVELYKFESDVKGLSENPEHIRFNEFVSIWKRDYAIKKLAVNTLSTYEYQLEKRILPKLGQMKLNAIRPPNIMRFYNELKNDGPRTVYFCHQILSTILEKAVRWQYINDNPCRRVEPPARPKTEIKIHDSKNLTKMLQALKNESLDYQIYTHIMLSGGLRSGEVVALQWNDIDFDKHAISITKTCQYVSGKGIVIKDTKSKSSFRAVVLPEYIFKMLKTYRVEWLKRKAKLGDKWVITENIFIQWNGGQMHPQTPAKWYKKFLKRNEIPHMRLYGLRHLHATLLIQNGENIVSVSKRLGHSEPSITTDVYAHYLKEHDIKVSDKMDEIMVKLDNGHKTGTET